MLRLAAHSSRRAERRAQHAGEKEPADLLCQWTVRATDICAANRGAGPVVWHQNSGDASGPWLSAGAGKEAHHHKGALENTLSPEAASNALTCG